MADSAWITLDNVTQHIPAPGFQTTMGTVGDISFVVGDRSVIAIPPGEPACLDPDTAARLLARFAGKYVDAPKPKWVTAQVLIPGGVGIGPDLATREKFDSGILS